MFGEEAPLPHGEEVAGSLSGLAAGRLCAGARPQDLRAGQAAVAPRPARLHRAARRADLRIPLLDVLLDYRLLADRIIHGTLGEVLAQAGHPPAGPPRRPTTPTKASDMFHIKQLELVHWDYWRRFSLPSTPRSSPSSAPTAPARPPCSTPCAPSSACAARASATSAATCGGQPQLRVDPRGWSPTGRAAPASGRSSRA